MKIQEILKFLEPFEPLIKSGIIQLESGAHDELKKLIQSNVSSPDLQALLIALEAAVDAFVKIEINKLP